MSTPTCEADNNCHHWSPLASSAGSKHPAVCDHLLPEEAPKCLRNYGRYSARRGLLRITQLATCYCFSSLVMATGIALPAGWRMDYDHTASKCFFVYEPTGVRQWDFPKAGDEVQPKEQSEGKDTQNSSLPNASEVQPSTSPERKDDTTTSQAAEEPAAQASGQDKNSTAQGKMQPAPHGDGTTSTAQTTAPVTSSPSQVESLSNSTSLSSAINHSPVENIAPHNEQQVLVTAPPANFMPIPSANNPMGPVLVYPNTGSPQGGGAQPLYVLPASAIANFVQGGLQQPGQMQPYYIIQAPQNAASELSLGTQPPPYSTALQITPQSAGTTKPAEQTTDAGSVQERERPSQELVQSPTESDLDADRSSLLSAKSPTQTSGDKEDGTETQLKKKSKWGSKTLKKTASRTRSIVKSTANKTENIIKATADKTGTIIKATADKTETIVKVTADKTESIVKATADRTETIVKATADKTETIVKTAADKTGSVVKGTLNNPATKFVGSAAIEVAGLHFGIVGASAVVNHSISKLSNNQNKDSDGQKAKINEGKSSTEEKTPAKNDPPVSPQTNTPQASPSTFLVIQQQPQQQQSQQQQQQQPTTVETQLAVAAAPSSPQQQTGSLQQLSNLPLIDPQQAIIQSQSPMMHVQVQSPVLSTTVVQAASPISTGTTSGNVVPADPPQDPTPTAVQLQQVQIPSPLATPPGQSGGGYFVMHSGAQGALPLHMSSLQSFSAQFAAAGTAPPNFVNAAGMQGVFAPYGAFTPPASPSASSPEVKPQEKPAATTEAAAAGQASAKARPSFLNKLARTITAPTILEGVIDIEFGGRVDNVDGTIEANIEADIVTDASSFIS